MKKHPRYPDFPNYRHPDFPAFIAKHPTIAQVIHDIEQTEKHDTNGVIRHMCQTLCETGNLSPLQIKRLDKELAAEGGEKVAKEPYSWFKNGYWGIDRPDAYEYSAGLDRLPLDIRVPAMVQILYGAWVKRKDDPLPPKVYGTLRLWYLDMAADEVLAARCHGIVPRSIITDLGLDINKRLDCNSRTLRGVVYTADLFIKPTSNKIAEENNCLFFLNGAWNAELVERWNLFAENNLIRELDDHENLVRLILADRIERRGLPSIDDPRNVRTSRNNAGNVQSSSGTSDGSDDFDYEDDDPCAGLEEEQGDS